MAAAPNDDAGKGKGLGAEDSGAAEEASGEAKMPSDASQAAPLRSLGTPLSDKVEAGRHKKHDRREQKVGNREKEQFDSDGGSNTP